MKYPFSSAASNADVKLSSVKGFALTGQMVLNRQIFARNEYSLYAAWMTALGFQQLTQKVEWDTSTGEAKSQIMDASTAIGLEFKF